jgi:hypothetical protein
MENVLTAFGWLSAPNKNKKEKTRVWCIAISTTYCYTHILQNALSEHFSGYVQTLADALKEIRNQVKVMQEVLKSGDSMFPGVMYPFKMVVSCL